MKNFAAIFVLIFLLSGKTFSYAADSTLTTYYPAPMGNYNKLQTSSLQLTASTLSAIQTRYHCSYDPTSGLSPCPAGIMYYDSDANQVYVSYGTHWAYLNATCVPVTACSSTLNCGHDSCGNSCGACLQGHCKDTSPNVPGSCH